MPDHEPKRLGAIPGFRPTRLPDGAWGAVLSDAYAAYLPAELVGRRIVVPDRRRRSWTAAVLEVVERCETSVIVRDSGRYAAPNRCSARRPADLFQALALNYLRRRASRHGPGTKAWRDWRRARRLTP